MNATGTGWTYALVTPDALITHALPRLLDTFRSAGLDPVAAELIRLDAETMVGLYDASTRGRSVTLPPPRAFQLWYDLGPACLTILRHDGADACAAMGLLKGATDPASARPGSIRHAGENILMNLVHCPDDEPSALAELRRLVGPRRAEALRRQAAVSDDRVRLLTVDTVEAAAPLFGGPHALSLPLAVNRLRLRVVQHLAITGRAVPDLLPLLEKARLALLEEHDELIGIETSPARTAAARARDGRVHALLRDAARAARAPAAENAVNGLSGVLMGSSELWAPLLEAIRAADVYLSDLESAVLEQSHYI